MRRGVFFGGVLTETRLGMAATLRGVAVVVVVVVVAVVSRVGCEGGFGVDGGVSGDWGGMCGVD
ncbi:hypothetical protein Sjap_004651 [Stephania japonica]|uniref:Uncharacterized protein n=1 Tax=Stephania japonica TaxID=461633 RepID=A0AAP0K2L7_9MAGN